MLDTVSVTLTQPQVGALLTVLGDYLGSDPLSYALPTNPAALLAAYFTLQTTHATEPGGWKPGRIELAAWAVAAITQMVAPPPAAKPKKAPRARKRPRARLIRHRKSRVPRPSAGSVTDAERVTEFAEQFEHAAQTEAGQ